MFKRSAIKKLLPALAVSGVLIASFLAAGGGQVLGAFSGYGYFGYLGYTNRVPNGVLNGGPDVASRAAFEVTIYVQGTDLQLWYDRWNGSTFSGWQPAGGVLTSDPGAVGWNNNDEVFVRGSDNQLWANNFNGAVWAGWQPLGGKLTSGPDADQWGNGAHVDVFVRGTDGQMWHKWSDNGTWYNWEPLGGQLTSDPGTVSWGTTRADVFVRGTDNQLWHKWWDGIAWRPWEPLGGVIASGTGPDVASCTSSSGSTNGHLDVFVIGTDNQLWRKGFNGSSWGQWQPLGGQWTSSPGAVCDQGTHNIWAVARGTDQGAWVVNVNPS
jgi:hypothetical protein